MATTEPPMLGSALIVAVPGAHRYRFVPRGADHREEDLGRQNVEIAAENKRVAEIRHALDETQQERVGEAGSKEGE